MAGENDMEHKGNLFMSDKPITAAELAAWQAQAAEEGGERLAMYQRYYEPNEFEYAPLMAFPRLLAEVERLRRDLADAKAALGEPNR